MIVAFPRDLAVTRPVEETLAIDSLSLVHSTVLSKAYSGKTVAVNCKVPPRDNSADALFKVTLSTVDPSTTVKEHEAVFAPLSVVTVIVVVPTFLSETTPLSTAATVVSLDDQLTFLLVAVSGNTVAVKVKAFALKSIVLLVSESATLSTGAAISSTIGKSPVDVRA